MIDKVHVDELLDAWTNAEGEKLEYVRLTGSAGGRFNVVIEDEAGEEGLVVLGVPNEETAMLLGAFTVWFAAHVAEQKPEPVVVEAPPSNVTELKRWLSVEDVTEILGYNNDTIRRMCRLGQLKGAWKQGKEWRIPRSALA